MQKVTFEFTLNALCFFSNERRHYKAEIARSEAFIFSFQGVNQKGSSQQ